MDNIKTKQIMQKTIITMGSRLNQIYEIIKTDPRNTELDYVFIQYAQELVSHIDTYEERFGK